MEIITLVTELGRPGIEREFAQESFEIFRPIEVREGVAEAGPEDMIDRVRVFRSCPAISNRHASNPAGAGQSGE